MSSACPNVEVPGLASAPSDEFAEDEQRSEELSALLGWVWTFPHMTGIERDDDARRSLEGQDAAVGILHVAREVFDVDDANDDDEMSAYCGGAWSQTSDLVDVELDPRDGLSGGKTGVLSALLCRAVSENCPLRESYIGRIMGMRADVQRSLMRIIERGIQMNTDGDGDDHDDSTQDATQEIRAAFSRSYSDDEDDDSLGSENDNDAQSTAADVGAKTPGRGGRGLSASPPQSFLRRPRESMSTPARPTGYTPARKKRHSDIGTADSKHTLTRTLTPVERREAIVRMKAELEELRDRKVETERELESSRRRETELSDKLGDMEGRHRSERMTIESGAIEREREMRDRHRAELDEARRELEELRDARRAAEKDREEIEALRDELDVLRHSHERLAAAEEQLRKAKLRLEQMGDAKELLTREEEAHNAAVAKCIELENDLKALAPLKRQLEDYKTRAVDAEVQLVECQDNLEKLKGERSGMFDENKALHEGVKIQKVETEEMRKKLLENGGNNGDGTAVGEGISELNPALKEELLRLRNENSTLREFASKREDDSVQMLEENLDDKNRLAARFREQFLQTKSKLESTHETLVQSVLREEKLQEEVAALNETVRALEVKIQEERRAHQKMSMDAERAFQAAKRSLIDKSRENAERREREMSVTLEEERRVAKEKLARAAEEKSEAEDRSTKALAELRIQSSQALRAVREKEQTRLEQQDQDYKSRIEQLTQEAFGERSKLMATGNGMINEAKEEAEKKVKEMEEQCEKKISDMEAKTQKFRGAQEQYEARAKSKLSTYKHKIHVMSGKQNQLAVENGEIQEKYKKLEREKKTLQEENDRFRRQIGTRLGGDSDVQKQFEKLQREFNLLLEENRKMKDNMESAAADQSICSFNPDAYILGGASEGAMTPYKGGGGGGNVSNATLDQLRSEYDDNLSSMQDEKRELIMRNSAAMSDVQKAEQRTWEVEEELSRTKSQLTSMTLALQRAEMRNGEQTAPSGMGGGGGMGESGWAYERSSGAVSRSQAMFSPDVSVIAPESRLTTPRRKPYRSGGDNLQIETGGEKENVVRSSHKVKSTPRSHGKPPTPLTPSNRVISTGTPRSGVSHAKSARRSPSLMEYTRVKADMVDDGNQECQQS